MKECIRHYAKFDTDHDGKPDWSVDAHTRSQSVLPPFDDDIDGDGIENILDANPFDASVPRNVLRPFPPPHLAMEGERGKLQRDLFERHGIIAVDHTDRHAPVALRALLTLLDHAFPNSMREATKSFRILYAFKGHDTRTDIAAYHRESLAISIGGQTSWGDQLEAPPTQYIRLLAALAHEIGHAFVFDSLSPHELGNVGSRFGSWQPVLNGDSIENFRAPAFFRSHPLRIAARAPKHAEQKADLKAKAEDFISKPIWIESNLVSQYATTNIHEWFADAFAAVLLQRLGERKQLESDQREPASIASASNIAKKVAPDEASKAPEEAWRARLKLPPDASSRWWVNYNNTTPQFREWLEQRLSSVTKDHQKKTQD